MDEFIKELDNRYELDSYKVKKDMVVFRVYCTEKELECPYCGQKSFSVHSIYVREIQDLPIIGKKSILLLQRRNR